MTARSAAGSHIIRGPGYASAFLSPSPSSACAAASWARLLMRSTRSPVPAPTPKSARGQAHYKTSRKSPTASAARGFFKLSHDQKSRLVWTEVPATFCAGP